MPGIRKQKIAIGYKVGSIKQASTPRDIGEPAKARADTLKWLKGEGPAPEHFSLLFPNDEEALNDYKNDLWVHPERAKADAIAAYQFIAEAGDGMKDLLKSEQIRLNAEKEALSTRVTELEPTAKVGSKVIDGGRARGLANAKAQVALRDQWERDLHTHYTDHPLTRHISYRTEADRLLTRDVRVMWTTDTPGYELLRKHLLPPLLRTLFPHLYS